MNIKIVSTSVVWLVAVIVPLVLVFDAAGHIGFTNFISLSAGVLAFSMMSVNLFLATRPPLIEGWLGGLDRVYALHRTFGIAIFVLILYHANFNMEIEGKVAASSLAKSSVEIAKLVYPVMAVLLAMSFIKRVPKLKRELPYSIWRWSHRLVGLLFIALFYHQFFVKLPFNNSSTVAAYTNVLGLIGVASFLWTQVGARLRRRMYAVSHVDPTPGATVFRLVPEGRGLNLNPGQFAFVSVGKAGLREPHPFTVSGRHSDGSLEFSVKPLGDFTRRLRERLAEGDKVRVEGGYGRFDYRKGGASQVWLAGGVGVTPFLAWADSLPEGDTRQIDLFYCVRTEDEAIGLDRLRAAERRLPGFRLHLHVSKTMGRLSGQTVIDGAQGPVGASSLWFCGPAPLRRAVLEGLKKAGQAPKSVHFEKFEFR